MSPTLNDHVIGQEQAKSLGGVGVQPLQTPAPSQSQRQRRIVEINIPLIGPTGSGKTPIGAVLGAQTGRAVRDGGCDHADRGGLCR